MAILLNICIAFNGNPVSEYLEDTFFNAASTMPPSANAGCWPGSNIVEPEANGLVCGVAGMLDGIVGAAAVFIGGGVAGVNDAFGIGS